jgi:hypothetical protein
MGRSTKILLLVLCEALLCSVVAASFWLGDLRYSLPTPRPAGLAEPPLGQAIALCDPLETAIGERGGEPCVLHFFNPACPCSRFNLDHLRRLIRDFGDDVTFVAILEGDDADALVEEFQSLDVAIPAVPDVDGRIAASLGVYATPQAVVLDGENRIALRGNYNASRYCVTPETEFVRIAIEGTLAGRSEFAWPSAATTAQGCELPANRIATGTEARR